MNELQRTYSSWYELKGAMEEGRAEWYGGAGEVPAAQHKLAERAWANLTQNFSQVAYR